MAIDGGRSALQEDVKATIYPLSISGRVGEPIWWMMDGPETHPIGLRLDCGDGGVIYLNKEQAQEIIDNLKSAIEEGY
jgi:hypothetical protein